MFIDLDSLSSPSHTARNNTRELVKKSEGLGYMSILHAVPMKPRVRVQKSATSKPTRKAEHPQLFKPTPQRAPGSTIGNTGSPNATSHLSGSPAATAKPSGIEEILIGAITALTAAIKVNTPKPVDSTPQALAATIAEDRRRSEAEAWNARRSAGQRLGFSFTAQKSDSKTVLLGMSPREVRMRGNVLAPAPASAVKKSEGDGEARRGGFDTYMQRRSIPK